MVPSVIDRVPVHGASCGTERSKVRAVPAAKLRVRFGLVGIRFPHLHGSLDLEKLQRLLTVLYETTNCQCQLSRNDSASERKGPSE